MSTRLRTAGMSLIEVVVFIVVLGIGIAGAVLLFNQLTVASVDPMVRKQLLALASSLLEEIELRPFTFCDPDQAEVFTATSASAAQCGGASGVEVIGPNEPSANAESRYVDPRFDNVNDYNGFGMADGLIKGPDNQVVPNLTGYSVTAAVANAGGVAPFATLPADAVLLITVTATHTPTGTAVSLQGYRFRYAPNSP